MIITHSYKLYHTKRTRHLDDLLGIAHDIYNHSIALHKRYYRLTGKTLKKNRLQKHIARLKKEKKYQRWNQLGSQAIQNIAERIDFGYQKYFRKENKRPPNFKKYHDYKSFTLKEVIGYTLNGNTLTINSLNKRFSFHYSRPLEGKVKTVTLKRNRLGEYHVFFALGVGNPKPKTVQDSGNKSRTVGLDFGLKTYLTTSKKEKITSPEFFKRDLSKIRIASQRLSVKKKGSNNRKKARKELARLHRNVTFKREAFQWELAHRLTDEYDIIKVESLNLRGMRALWGRKISDLAHYKFLLKLEYLCEKKGKKFEKIDPFYPSTKTCHSCKVKNESITLRDRVFSCASCGYQEDRDVNAALNIEDYTGGTSSVGGAPVRPAA